ncbi:MAG: zinc ABC transporter substrate-binding protein [Proteobacteria bacterium]|nr:zinc ABC transporter substrate-binding protein [Pseudomonadota bacterium]
MTFGNLAATPSLLSRRAGLAATAFVVSMLAFVSGTATAAPNVVVSIQPLHSLVAQVMDGIGEPVLLLPPGASPHDFAMRPSDAAALTAADVVFWAGPELEAFLERTLDGLAGADVVALGRSPGLMLLPARIADAGDDGADPHFWMDTANAGISVSAIAAALAAADPDHAADYAANAAAAAARLAALDAELAAMLLPGRDVALMFLHDSMQYLTRRYGLRDLGPLAASPDQAPGARTMLAARRQLSEAGSGCLVTDRATPPGLAAALVDGTGARIARADPLGAGIAPGAHAYGDMLRAVAEALRGCLTP